MTKDEAISLIGKELKILNVIKSYNGIKRRKVVYTVEYECPYCLNPSRIYINNILNKGIPKACNKCTPKLKDCHHGYGTRIFGIWGNLRARCHNTKHRDYHNYGGRGITVCQEWDSFESFRDWSLSHGYQEDLSIDRINNDRGYSPDNCRWVGRITQGSNKRNNIMCTHNGITKSLMEWANELGYDKVKLRSMYRAHPNEDIIDMYKSKYNTI